VRAANPARIDEAFSQALNAVAEAPGGSGGHVPPIRLASIWWRSLFESRDFLDGVWVVALRHTDLAAAARTSLRVELLRLAEEVEADRLAALFRVFAGTQPVAGRLEIDAGVVSFRRRLTGAVFDAWSGLAARRWLLAADADVGASIFRPVMVMMFLPAGRSRRRFNEADAAGAERRAGQKAQCAPARSLAGSRTDDSIELLALHRWLQSGATAISCGRTTTES
jgi:hypothetical protein